jgi:CDP-paratose 2-epimerase
MATAVVSGAGGLVGAESSAFLCEQGFDVIGIENDLRAQFFGAGASTARQIQHLRETYDTFRHVESDIRDADAVGRVFSSEGARIELVVHTAAQPSHDWAADDPVTDFTVNANGTLVLLEATRRNLA